MDIQPIHPEPTSFLKRYVFSEDHKYIAKQFLWAGLLFLLFGGVLAMAIRWHWAYPGQAVPAVVAAAPGIVTLKDLPPVTGRFAG